MTDAGYRPWKRELAEPALADEGQVAWRSLLDQSRQSIGELRGLCSDLDHRMETGAKLLRALRHEHNVQRRAETEDRFRLIEARLARLEDAISRLTAAAPSAGPRLADAA
jgi:hypothetical protein